MRRLVLVSLATIAVAGSFRVFAAAKNVNVSGGQIAGAGVAMRVPQLSPAHGDRYDGRCEALAANIAGFPNTTITSSATVAAGTLKVGGQDIAEHCVVSGKMFTRTSPVDGNAYAIGFEMRLPRNWNGRFFHQGNGGNDGVVLPAVGAHGGGPVTNALHKGFAVLSSDAGHVASQNPSFGIDPQARLDYGYQTVAKLTPMAKSLISLTYGKGPDRSYFGGCSNGGRHALVTAARLPNDYDGILAGAPGYNLPKAAVANIAGAQLYAPLVTVSSIRSPADLETAYTPTERRLVAAAVLARCDALDGASDGLVQDVAACQSTFNLARDVPTCANGRDGSCLSSAQKSAIGKIFSGPTTSDGALIYAPFPWDGGLGAAGVSNFEFSVPLTLDAGTVGLIFKVPPEPFVGFNGPAFSLTANMDALVAQINATNRVYAESAMSFMTPPNAADLSALQERGGKVLAYHGISDQILSALDTEAWYKALHTKGGSQVRDFARYFRVPGMGHCSGGPSTDQFDMLQTLVDWVEFGIAPEAVIARSRGVGNPGGANSEVPASWSPGRTRPLCAFPMVARYKGSGNIEDAENFNCQR